MITHSLFIFESKTHPLIRLVGSCVKRILDGFGGWVPKAKYRWGHKKFHLSPFLLSTFDNTGIV